MTKRPSARQQAARKRAEAAPAHVDPRLCPRHRSYVHRGAPCKWCTAGYPTIAENQMITMLDAIVEVDAPEVRTSGDDLRRRIADLA